MTLFKYKNIGVSEWRNVYYYTFGELRNGSNYSLVQSRANLIGKLFISLIRH